MPENNTEITDADIALIANEVAEGINNAIVFVRLSNRDKVKVLKCIADAEIGSDPGAILPNIPGLTPEITEAVTDPLLDMVFTAIVNRWFPEPIE